MPFNCFAVFTDYLAKLQQNDTRARTRVVTLRVACMPVHPSRLILMSLICSMKLCTSASSGVPRGGGLNPPPEIPKFWQSRTGLQIERKMCSVPIPIP